ncbi:VOC family protein [Halobacillus salinarum]|uniref:VOC family protein n=1 Tax=Halobacillus salinarum TaxID=2932257 RepID=A0ABY4EMC0_9BACI|nr:VOC family protein [Halobacillus salinarum]UOQ43256.1 VOC family protein [Halobacillus salinarum]
MHLLGISHITYAVRDLDDSVRFYERALKAKRLMKGKTSAYFEVAGQWLALNQETISEETKAPLTYTHLAFYVSEKDFSSWQLHLEREGVAIEEGRKREPDGEGHSIYFRDPDNHLLELHTGTLEKRIDFYKRTSVEKKFYL